MRNDKFFRGKVVCSECVQEEKTNTKTRWGYREVDSLYAQEDGTYIGICFEHREKRRKAGTAMPEMSLFNQCFHFPWRDVVKLTLHKPAVDRTDRLGSIMTIEMRTVANTALMRTHAIEAAHGLQLIADDHAVIHNYGERGEGNDCWTEPNYHWEAPATCTINDKYWGDKRIAKFQDVCRLMCRVHGWELVDETVGVLDRIVLALDGPEEPL